MGFFRMRSAEVVSVPHCPAADSKINAILQPLIHFLNTEQLCRGVCEVEINTGESGEITLLLHIGDGMKGPALHRLAEAALELEGVQAAAAAAPVALAMAGSPPILYSLCQESRVLTFRISPPAFMQANLSANRTLVAAVTEYAAVESGNLVLDLFCGAGNLSLPLAVRGVEVLGVDQSIQAIRCASNNAAENHIDNVQFICRSSHEAVEDLKRQGRRPDLVVMDPPRSGAKEVVESLLKLCPPRIVYVSCNPATLARDMKTLLTGGYRAARAMPVDMFSQTSHIEAVMVVDRK